MNHVSFLLSLTPIDFENRSNYLTASNFPKILNRGYTKNRIKIPNFREEYLKELLGEIKPKVPYSAFTNHGNKYEKTARKMFEKQSGLKVHLLKTLCHDQVHVGGHSFIAGTVDGLTEDGYVVEIKCPYYHPDTGCKIPEKVEVPSHYEDQAMGYVWILKAKGYYFVQYYHHPKKDKRKITIVKKEWDPQWQIDNEPKIVSFWEEYQKKRQEKKDKFLEFYFECLKKSKIE